MSDSILDSQKSNALITPVLVAGCIIILVSFAIRASFGVFQIPIAAEFNWFRADFSFAIAVQNLFWGIGQPLFGALAEKYGDRKAIVAGAFCYAIGLVLSSYAITPGQHQLLEILVGFGIAGTGFGVILAVVGRATPEKHRSFALGIATAAGSAGQVVGPPTAEFLLQSMPWQTVFIIFAGFVLLSLFSLSFMKIAPPAKLNAVDKGLVNGRLMNGSLADESLSDVIAKAIKDPTFLMIFVGFFSCGYQLAFITAHFPAFIAEVCGAVIPGSLIHNLGITTTSTLGAISIALIGVTNICGTLLAGYLGSKYSRKYLLAGIYFGRTVIATAFIMSPITPESVVIFAIMMGSLWLATVPLTSGLIAQIFGIRYIGTLYGLVFFSHQLGGFLGVWLGGIMYDSYGDYTLVWWIGIGVGAFSALIHLPVDERPWHQRSAIVGV